MPDTMNLNDFIYVTACLIIITVSVVTLPEWFFTGVVTNSQFYGFCGIIIAVTTISEILLLLTHRN